jgi:hypothetical protein
MTSFIVAEDGNVIIQVEMSYCLFGEAHMTAENIISCVEDIVSFVLGENHLTVKK